MVATVAKEQPRSLISRQGARFVPLDHLVLGLGEYQNVRTDTGLEDDEIAELAESIWEFGLDPLLVLQVLANSKVTPPPKGTAAGYGACYELVIDGQRRDLALIYLAKSGRIATNEPIPVNDLPGPKPYEQVVGKSVAEIKAIALALGLHRAGLSTYEQLVAAADLLRLDKKQAEIAKILGRSEAWVSKMMAAWKASTDQLKAALRRGKITDEQFKELAQVKADKQPEHVAEIVNLRERGARKEAFDKSREVAGLPRKTGAASSSPNKPAAPAPTGKGKLVYPDAPAAASKASRGLDLQVGEILSLAQIEKPLDQYTKGVYDMARVVAGQMGTPELGKPFKHWLGRVQKKLQKRAKPQPRGGGEPDWRVPSARGARPLKLSKPMAKAVAGGKKAVTNAPRGGAKSKACSARHHDRCKDLLKRGEIASCGCDCHGGKS